MCSPVNASSGTQSPDVRLVPAADYAALVAELDALRGFATQVEAEMTRVVAWADTYPHASIAVGKDAAKQLLRRKAEAEHAK